MGGDFRSPRLGPPVLRLWKTTATRGEPGTRLNFRPVTIPTKTGNIKFSAREREAEAPPENRSRFTRRLLNDHVFRPRTHNSRRTRSLPSNAPAGVRGAKSAVGRAISRFPRGRLQHSLGRGLRLRDSEYPKPGIAPPGTQPPWHELRRADGRAGSAPLGLPAGMGNAEPVPHLPHQTAALTEYVKTRACVQNKQGCPISRVFCEKWGIPQPQQHRRHSRGPLTHLRFAV